MRSLNGIYLPLRTGEFEAQFRTLGIDPSRVEPPPHVVGNSEYTFVKLLEFRRLIDVLVSYIVNMNIRQSRTGGTPFTFVGLDLTAGCGDYLLQTDKWDEPVLGMGLLMLEAVIRHELPYRIGLIEEDPNAFERLRDLIDNRSAIDSSLVDVLPGRYQEQASPWLTQYGGYRKTGALLIDHNQIFFDKDIFTLGAHPSLGMLDVVMHLPGVGYKWPRSARPRSTIAEIRGAFRKDFWQIGGFRGPYKWVFEYGSNNWKMRQLKEIGYVDVQSMIGRQREDDIQNKIGRR